MNISRSTSAKRVNHTVTDMQWDEKNLKIVIALSLYIYIKEKLKFIYKLGIAQIKTEVLFILLIRRVTLSEEIEENTF